MSESTPSRKDQLEAAQQTVKFFETLLHASSDGIVITDTRQNIIAVNQAFCSFFGRDLKEIKETGLFTWLEQLGPGAPQRWAELEKHVHLEGTCSNVQFQVTGKDGMKHQSVNASLMKQEPGKGEDTIISIWRDITRQKQAESVLRREHDELELRVRERTKELVEANEKLKQEIKERQRTEVERQKLEEQLVQARKMEAIGNLAGGIAHDFNNILGVIIGYADLAKDDIPAGGRARHNLEKVLGAADRAAELVKQILTFSRKAEKKRKPIYVSKIPKETLSLLRATLPTTIEIRQNFREKSNPVLGNPTQIHQVIMNICANAAHAMREKGGILEITLKEIEIEPASIKEKELEPGRYQCLTFTDTGCGMTPGIKKRVFEPYFTTKEEGEGTRMGLAVVHGIVKSHQGDITLHSEPGKGTTFHIYLPVTQQDQALKEEPGKPIPMGNERVLFVEDEELLIETGKEMLRKLGYEVYAQPGSIEALEAFRETPNQFDLVITDQTMPNMTGLRLAQELRRIRPDIPIILCTGFSETINEENFKAQGIDGFVMKPMLKKNIARVIRDVLDK